MNFVFRPRPLLTVLKNVSTTNTLLVCVMLTVSAMCHWYVSWQHWHSWRILYLMEVMGERRK